MLDALPPEWADGLADLGKLIFAFLLALPIAWEREKSDRSMGLRTFPLVAIGCCAYVLVAANFLPESDNGAEARVLQGILSGIGFIGGGAILKGKGSVQGTATAASIWIVGAMGVAIGHGDYPIAIVLAATTFALLYWLTSLKGTLKEQEEAIEKD